ncbi:MAG: hypothetical protein WC722_17020, partial [Rhodospirillales bacterium]
MSVESPAGLGFCARAWLQGQQAPPLWLTIWTFSVLAPTLRRFGDFTDMSRHLLTCPHCDALHHRPALP